MSALGGQAESGKTTTRPVTERIKASVVKGHLSHRKFCDLSGPLRLLEVARGIVAENYAIAVRMFLKFVQAAITRHALSDTVNFRGDKPSAGTVTRRKAGRDRYRTDGGFPAYTA